VIRKFGQKETGLAEYSGFFILTLILVFYIFHKTGCHEHPNKKEQ